MTCYVSHHTGQAEYKVMRVLPTYNSAEPAAYHTPRVSPVQRYPQTVG